MRCSIPKVKLVCRREERGLITETSRTPQTECQQIASPHRVAQFFYLTKGRRHSCGEIFWKKATKCVRVAAEYYRLAGQAAQAGTDAGAKSAGKSSGLITTDGVANDEVMKMADEINQGQESLVR